MGRSRLVYRSKHKGILSENSRKEIREAHLQRKQERVAQEASNEEVNTIREESGESTDDVETVNKVDLFSLPKLYVRESELETYEKDIQMEKYLQSMIPDEEKVVHAIDKIPMESLFVSDFFDHDICKMVQEEESGTHLPSLENTPVETKNEVTPSLQQTTQQSVRGEDDLELQDRLDSLLGL